MVLEHWLDHPPDGEHLAGVALGVKRTKPVKTRAAAPDNGTATPSVSVSRDQPEPWS
jgi:hypothetical protein